MVHWNKGLFSSPNLTVLKTRLANPYKSSLFAPTRYLSPQRCDFTFQLPVFRSCQSRILSTHPPPKREMRRPSHHLQPLRGSMYCWQDVAGMVTNALPLFNHNLLISLRANPVTRYLTMCDTLQINMKLHLVPHLVSGNALLNSMEDSNTFEKKVAESLWT